MKKLLLLLMIVPMISFGQISNFIATTECEGSPTNFINLPLGGVPPYMYQWDFGDGTTSSSQNPSHLYVMCGNYNVSLIATDVNGLSDTSINLVVVHCSPVANFTSSNVCEGDCTIFTDYSISGSSPILSWNWNMGGAGAYVGGTTNTSQNPEYCFDNCGTYNVSLDITDANGCVSSISTSIQVFCNPIADFIWSPIPACIGDTVCFTDASVFANGVINLWYWDFGSISASTLPNPCYIYANTGIYNVTLSVTDSWGCEDTTTQSIFIDSCNISTGINNLTILNKQLLKVTDILGRETPYKKNTPLFYIYDDGTVEKKIIIE